MSCKNCSCKTKELEYKSDRNNSIVFIVLILAMTIASIWGSTAKATTFTYKNDMKIEAATYNQAAKECYKRLTGGKYPGEERGLDIIDVCVNPKETKK